MYEGTLSVLPDNICRAKVARAASHKVALIFDVDVVPQRHEKFSRRVSMIRRLKSSWTSSYAALHNPTPLASINILDQDALAKPR